METSTRKEVAGALEHVRLIHFTLVLVAATLLYIVTSTWSEAPDVRRELADLTLTLDRLNQGTATIADLMPPKWSDDRGASLLDGIEKGIAQKVAGDALNRRPIGPLLEFDRKVVLSKLNISWPDAQSADLQKIRSALTGAVWSVPTVATVAIDQATIDWARANLDKPMLTTWGSSGTSLEFRKIEAAPADDNGAIKALVDFRILEFVYTPGEFSQSHVTVSEKSSKQAEVLLTTAPGEARLPEHWFEQRFPHLCRGWSAVESKSLSSALDATEKELREALRAYEPNLLGISVHGSDLGYVGPIAILVILVYLLTYLDHVAALTSHPAWVRATGRNMDFIPWMGAMPGYLPLALLMLTLVGLPSGSVYLALDRFSKVDVRLEWVWFGLVVVLAIGCTIKARQISRSYAATRPAVRRRRLMSWPPPG
jgi:hypothetical protein